MTASTSRSDPNGSLLKTYFSECIAEYEYVSQDRRTSHYTTCQAALKHLELIEASPETNMYIRKLTISRKTSFLPFFRSCTTHHFTSIPQVFRIVATEVVRRPRI